MWHLRAILLLSRKIARFLSNGIGTSLHFWNKSCWLLLIPTAHKAAPSKRTGYMETSEAISIACSAQEDGCHIKYFRFCGGYHLCLAGRSQRCADAGGFPSRAQRSNKHRLITAHRVGGYLFVILFCIMAYCCFRRLRPGCLRSKKSSTSCTAIHSNGILA
jgi:hypothetical protein